MNCLDIIAKFLTENGFDGLCNYDAECGCGVESLCPCCGDFSDCVPAYDHGPMRGYDNFYHTDRPFHVKGDNPSPGAEKETK